ncbi:hypothetical protein TNCV_1076841 [Trichonephila clavipes]|uniref:Uncharacterized protein n=1 Tax=Trichonephila clavipes TaxID=2585209 RepID=A0A8X6RLX9_TRICX|nr:hypothetical protein TNCV_1076841 [Trichonephila clavipes]
MTISVASKEQTWGYTLPSRKKGGSPLERNSFFWRSSVNSRCFKVQTFLMIANPYDVQMEKLQYIGVVQKCMGTRLLDFKSETEKKVK